jgi:AcrR family transcriptional regulator
MSSRGPAGDTTERILDAAERCLPRLGLSRLNITDVARQAGLSRGAVYLHFGDRAALRDAVLARAAQRFVASSAPVLARRRTLAAQVAEAAVFIRQHLGDRVLTLRLPAEEETPLAALLSARADRLVAEWVEFWQPFLAQAAARGEIRADLDRRQAAEWIVRLMLSFAVMPAVTFDDDDPAAVFAFVRDHVVAGLGPVPAAPRPRRAPTRRTEGVHR